jgi:hypothetical protein
MAVGIPFATTWPGYLAKVIPSYLFQEFADDEDMQAFIAAYNQLAQQYVGWFSTISLPIYTGHMIAGNLLDWVAVGIYGVPRPTLASGTIMKIGPYNTYAYNTLGFNMSRTMSNTMAFVATDNTYKRVLTWQHYKGDGFFFNITWLKRRIMRFIAGDSGTDPIDMTNDLSDISVIPSGGAFAIQINNSGTYTGASAFVACITSGVLNVPFQFTFTAVLA